MSIARLRGVLLIAIALLRPPASGADPLFSAPFLSFDTGAAPLSVAIGDLNGDGRPDLAVANYAYGSGHTVSVLLGNGDGTFGAKSDCPTGAGTYSVAIGDLNGDGKLDLAAANAQDNTVSVLLGNGNGTFGPRADYVTGLTPYSVAIGDMNGDEWPDLVLANYYASSVSMLLGSGDGTFGAKHDFETGAHPHSVAIGDLNGDGKLDVAVANEGADPDRIGTVSVLLGNGDGTFGPQSVYPVANSRPYSSPRAVAIGDLNGDGTPDLAVANYGLGMTPLLGNGDGTFRSLGEYSMGSNSYPASVAIGDFDVDGKADLVLANSGSNTISVLQGIGDGRSWLKRDYGTGVAPFSAVIGDLNGDGRLDVATANQLSSSAGVLLGNGNGTFGSMSDFLAGDNPWSVTMGDLNGDGKPDIVVPHYYGNTVGVLMGNGGGSFGASLDYTVVNNPNRAAIGDLNGDGKLDLSVVSGATDNTGGTVLLGNGDGTFGPKIDYAAGNSARSVAMEDLNGDGKVDLVTTNGFQNTVSVLLGNGNGTFRPRVGYATGDEPRSVAVGDLNGDGKPDLVAADAGVHQSDPGYVSVLLGNGDGTLGLKNDYESGSTPWFVAIGDMSGDGIVDLVVPNVDDDKVSVLLGNGDGTFGRKGEYGTGQDPFCVAIGDLNADGNPDLAVANFQSNTVSVLLGNGNGTFGLKTDYGTGDGPSSLAIGDVTADGMPDLVVSDFRSNAVTVLVNRSPGIPTAALLSFFQADWAGEIIEVRWQWGQTASVMATEVRRSESRAGPWTVVSGSPRELDGKQLLADRGVAPGRNYYYKLVATERLGGEISFGPFAVTGPTGVSDFALLPVIPNPSRGVAQFEFMMPREAFIQLSVWDLQGRRVAVLADGMQALGYHRVVWDGSGTRGGAHPGLYLVRLEWLGGRSTRRFVLIR